MLFRPTGRRRRVPDLRGPEPWQFYGVPSKFLDFFTMRGGGRDDWFLFYTGQSGADLNVE